MLLQLVVWSCARFPATIPYDCGCTQMIVWGKADVAWCQAMENPQIMIGNKECPFFSDISSWFVSKYGRLWYQMFLSLMGKMCRNSDFELGWNYHNLTRWQSQFFAEHHSQLMMLTSKSTYRKHAIVESKQMPWNSFVNLERNTGLLSQFIQRYIGIGYIYIYIYLYKCIYIYIYIYT